VTEIRGRFDFSDVTGGTEAPSIEGGAFGSRPGWSTPEITGASRPGGWGETANPSAATGVSTSVAGPPMAWIFASGGLAVFSVLTAVFLGGSPVFAIGSWVLGGPVAIALFAVFTHRDTVRRVNVLYSSRTWTTWVYGAGLVLVFTAIAVSAIQIALWVGRL
jgi:hypothetical protein